MTNQIATAVEEQTNTSNEISQRMGWVKEMAAGIAVHADKTIDASVRLTNTGNGLSERVSVFTVV